MNNQLKGSFDVVVVGGGIAGIGAAREAVKRGYRTALVERGACAQATSDSSLRIIHGGLRYLQGLQVQRVFESLREQIALLGEYPEFIKPLPCVMPLNRFGLKSRIPAGVAVGLYGALASYLQKQSYPGGILSSTDVSEKIEVFTSGGAEYGCLLWQDAILIDPDGFSRVLLSEFKGASGEVYEGRPVCRVSRQESGQFLVQTEAGDTFESRVVLNTSGAWLRRIETDFHTPERQLKWAKAFNLILNSQIEPRYGIGIQSSEGRLFFLTPRTLNSGEKVSVVGTWYSMFADNPSDCDVSEQEIELALAELNTTLPGRKLMPGDVSRAEVGVLPASGVRGVDPQLIGASQYVDSAGYIEVISTKYTTFQSQGRRALDIAEKYLE